ncbi:hypothetical protein Acr_21g0004430 [Actinidia rufa]|uniref:Integrase catalytic domain-containing protein n=1 Tax=Actinidia rufa TaxID=165716 RepID=A0A7J0GGF9_9ERIC|nr:hypothetical protein Acr_21g0004430 [Actinidia rufa]
MSSRLKVFTEIVELERTLELPRDNVRNARAMRGGNLWEVGAWHLAVREVKVGRDRGIPSNLLKVSRVSGHLFLPGLGDTRRDHQSLATSVAKRGHIRAHCPQTPSQLRPPPPPHSQTPSACFGSAAEVGSEFWSESAEGYTESTTLPSDYYWSGTTGRPWSKFFCTESDYTGASHSFIAASFVLALGLETEELNPPLFVDTPIGGRMSLDRICRGCELVILDHHFVFDFIVLGMSGFDLILGMDWLSTFRATIDCFKRRVRICTLEGGCLEFFGECQESFEPYLYELRDKGSIAYLLASLTLDEDLSTRGELPRVVCDFLDIFPEELPGLPPEREVEFTIDLLSGTAPISMPPYRFAPAELRELKTQLQELQDLGFIRPSTSPWGAPALFAQKKDGSLRLWKPASLWSLVIEEWRMVRDLGFYALHCEELSEGVTLCNLTVHSTLLTRVVDAQQDDEETGVLRTKFLSGEASEGWSIHADQSIRFQGKLFVPIACREEIFTRVPPFSFSRTSRRNIKDRGRATTVTGSRVEMGARDYGFRYGLLLSTAYHPQTDGQSERTIQILEDKLQACVLDFRGSWEDHVSLVEFAYNNSYQSSIEMAPYEALYGRPCRSPVCWTELGEATVVGPELVAETAESMGLIRKRLKAAQKATTEKVKVIRQRLLTAQSRQKSYADRRRRPLSFEVGDHVFLKISPRRGLHRFGRGGKLSPRYIGPFDIIERIGEVAYRLALPPKLSGVHDVFHVSMLKKYEPDPSHVLEWSKLELEADASFEEKPIRVVDFREKVLRARIALFSTLEAQIRDLGFVEG